MNDDVILLNDDVILLNDQKLNSTSRNSLTFCKKKLSARSIGQTTTNKLETAINISSNCDNHIDARTNYISKHERKLGSNFGVLLELIHSTPRRLKTKRQDCL